MKENWQEKQIEKDTITTQTEGNIYLICETKGERKNDIIGYI